MSSTGVRASPALRSDVRSLIEEIGVNETSKALGIGREAVARIAAGFGVRRGTLFLAEKSLKERAKRS